MTAEAIAQTSATTEDPFRIGYRYVHTGQLDAKGRPESEMVPLTMEDFLHPQEGDRFLLTDNHTLNLAILCNAMEVCVQELPKVKILSDHRIDWQVEGIRPHGPDLVAIENFPIEWNADRGTYPVKDYDSRPLVVVEVTSAETRKGDFETKYLEYEAAGIPYYIIVDVAGPPGAPRILGYRNGRQGFQQMRHHPNLGFLLPSVRMWIRWEEDRVKVADEDGQDILDNVEVHEALKEIQQELGRKNAELDLKNAELALECQRSEHEKQRAENEKQRAEYEKQRADELARELAELKARLDGTK
jgi:Uma2 family endonuclease